MEENKKRSIHDLIKEHSNEKILDTETIYEINLDEIVPNNEQPRKHFDPKSLEELASSIKDHGVLQPIILRKQGNNNVIIAGERRYKAALIAGLVKIPAVIRTYTDLEIAEISLIENIQREDLSAIEEAKAYNIIINKMGITQNDLANKIGKSRSYVTNILGLLNLPTEIQSMLLEQKLSMGHARTLSKLDDKNKMLELANQIIKEELTVREIEELTKGEQKRKEIKRENYNKTYKVEREMLAKHYSSKVQIKNNAIVFKISDENKLQEIIEKLIKNAL